MRQQLAIIQPSIAINQPINPNGMFPFKKYHNNISSYSNVHSFANRPADQMCVDQASFNELCRKVDCLVDEVCTIKQTLMNSERRLWERNQLYDYHSPHDQRMRAAATHSQLTRISPLEESYDSSMSENFRPEVIIPSEIGGNKSPLSFLRRNSECYELKTSNETVMMKSASMMNRRYASKLSEADLHKMSASPLPPDLVPASNEMSRDKSSLPEDTLSISNMFFRTDSINIAEIIIMWDKGMNDIPPISKWSPHLKLQYQNHLKDWFKIYHMFCTLCHGDIGRFISRFTDNSGQMMSVHQVASVCPDVSKNYELFLQLNETHLNEKETLSGDIQRMQLFILPRKINGRKVSAKDVIQLWEYGIGDIPPIKTWTKTQKFKQQSKISRWKKIVDIFKYQCNNDMKKFESMYTDEHGCLLPVAAITSKFETLYGDELNITSKLMTVSTSSCVTPTRPSFSPCFNPPKRSFHSSLDDEEHSMNRSKLREKHVEYSTTDDEDDSYSNGHISPTKKRTLPFEIIAADDENMVSNKQFKLEKSCSTRVPSKLILPKDLIILPEEQCSLNYSNELSPSNSESEDDINKCEIISENISVEQCIEYWGKGCDKFPPVSKWDEHQKSKQKSLIEKMEKIFYIYQYLFKKNLKMFLGSCMDSNKVLLSLNQVLNKFQNHVALSDPLNQHDENEVSKASSMTFDFSHHRTISQCPEVLYLLPRKINGRKVNAKDVLQLWYYGLNKIPPVREWSPQHKAVQQSKISRWKKIVDLFEQEYDKNWEKFEQSFSNNLGQLLPITAIISKHEESYRSYDGRMTNVFT